MFCKPFVALNIFIFLIIIFCFVINIISNNYVYRHRYYLLSPQELNESVSESIGTTDVTLVVKENNTKTFKSFSELKSIHLRVNKTDEYLKSLSKLMIKRNDSKLIFPNEMSQIIDITIDHKSCSEQYGKDLLLVVLVFNRVNAFERRKTIRETWGQQIRDSNRSQLYFAVGLSRDATVQPILSKENEEFSDILQFNYYEDYYNCTIKALALLRWTALSCPFVKFMLKVDDDSLVLPQNMLEFCDNTEPNSIYGYLWRKPDVFRGQNKWGVSVKDYPNSHYPDYIGGPYLIPGHKALDLYEKAIDKCLPALHFEDVYITGIVANVTGIERKKLDTLLCVWDTCPVLKLDFCYYKSFTILWQGFHDKQLRKVWKMFQNGNVCPNYGGIKC